MNVAYYRVVCARVRHKCEIPPKLYFFLNIASKQDFSFSFSQIETRTLCDDKLVENKNPKKNDT